MGVDVYKREISDLINHIPVAALGNLTNYLNTNIGNLESKGFEYEINAMAIDTRDWTWSIGANVAYNDAKFTKLTASPNDKTGVETGGISGGVGNIIDRIRLQYVVDYIEPTFVNFAVFNFADCLITVGAFILIIYLVVDLIKDIRNEKNPVNDA